MASGGTVTLENHETGEVFVFHVTEAEMYAHVNVPVLKVLSKEES